MHAQDHQRQAHAHQPHHALSLLQRDVGGGDVEQQHPWIDRRAELAQRIGKRRRIAGTHAHVEAGGIQVAGGDGVIDPAFRLVVQRSGSREVGHHADDLIPAFRHDIPDGASPTYLIRRPSGLAPLNTWSTSARLTSTPGVTPAASADASAAVRSRPMLTGTSNAEKKLGVTRLNRTNVRRLVPSTGTPSASSTTKSSRPGLVSENVTSRTRESSFRRRSISASAPPYRAANALSPAPVGDAAVRSSDRLALRNSAVA